MSSVTITITGLNETKAALNPAKVTKHMPVVMRGACDIVRRKLAKYPSRPKGGGWVQKMGEKQRRGFFYLLNKGKIEVPYRRGQSPGSQKLGASWAINVTGNASYTEGTVGTKVSYARWVMDKEQQAPIHQGRWQTVQDVAVDVTPAVNEFFENAIDRLMV